MRLLGIYITANLSLDINLISFFYYLFLRIEGEFQTVGKPLHLYHSGGRICLSAALASGVYTVRVTFSASLQTPSSISSGGDFYKDCKHLLLSNA